MKIWLQKIKIKIKRIFLQYFKKIIILIYYKNKKLNNIKKIKKLQLLKHKMTNEFKLKNKIKQLKQHILKLIINLKILYKTIL